VNFSATKLNGICNLFMFQFFEMSTFLNTDLEYHNVTSPNTTEKHAKLTKDEQNIKLKKYFEKYEMKQMISEQYLNVKSINLLTKKYPVLTQSEVIICSLIASNFSAKQISEITCKLVRSVHRSISRILEKLRLKTRQELYQQLIE